MSVLAADGRALIVAMDHARTHGHVEGLEDPGRIIDAAIEGGADGIMTSFGIIKHYRSRLAGAIPTFMRLDGGPSLYREDWLANTEWSQLHTVEEAQMLGCQGVVLMLFMGLPIELTTMQIVAETANECLRVNMPLVVEALPAKSERIPNPKDDIAMAAASRLGFEHGADYIKTYYTGTVAGFRKVVENVPVPVLLAGGARMDTDLQVLTFVSEVLEAGAKGVFLGRNIWQNPKPAAMVRALRRVIHENATPAEALEELK